jgi:hypothetical protein
LILFDEKIIRQLANKNGENVMKNKILALAFIVATIATAKTVHAEDKDLLVGKWELNATANGPDLERGYIVFRENGTGRLERRPTGEPTTRSNFTWKMEGAVIRLTYPPRDIRQMRYRFDDTNSLVLIPTNSRLEPGDTELYYFREFGKISASKATAKKQVVGVWEAVITVNGITCHDVVVLRIYGTGENTTLCGPQRQYEEFNWELIDGDVVKFRPNGTNTRGRVRLIDKTNFTVTAIDYYGAVTSPEIYYTKIFDSDEGC